VAGAAVTQALRRLTPKQLRLLGSAVTTTGAMGLLVFIGRDLNRWLGLLPPELHRYAFQRILFAVGTNTDVPLVQVIAAGAVCWVVGTFRKKRIGPSPPSIRRPGQPATPLQDKIGHPGPATGTTRWG
jgi:hypothetical protein